MFRKKRRSSSRFKARVALEALRGDKTVREIADRNDIHPTQVGAWRDRAETHLHEIFRDDQPSKVSGIQALLGSIEQILVGCLLGVGLFLLLFLLLAVLTSFLV